MRPNVYWAQTETDILLKVKIRNLHSDPNIQVEDEELKFEASGENESYNFSIEFFLPIKSERSAYRVTDSEVRIRLPKKEPDWWPRLPHGSSKLPWLKIDFDKWQENEDSVHYYSSSDSEPSIGVVSSEDFLRTKYPEVYKNLRTSELGYISESKRKVYLFVYNLFMFTGFLYVLTVICILWSKGGDAFMPETYDSVGTIIRILYLLMILEILHPIFGYTRTSSVFSLVRVGGRNFILSVLLGMEPRMRDKPVIFYLFFIYCLDELFRFPYYILSVYHYKLGIVTWIRYTPWIFLYPAAFMCEGVVVLRNIPYFEETGNLSLYLPNPINFAFYFPSVLRIYLLFVFFPTLYVTMQSMYGQRCKKLGIRPYKKNT